MKFNNEKHDRYFLEYAYIDYRLTPLKFLIQNEVYAAVAKAFNSLSYYSKQLLEELIIEGNSILDFTKSNQLKLLDVSYDLDKALSLFKQLFNEEYYGESL